MDEKCHNYRTDPFQLPASPCLPDVLPLWRVNPLPSRGIVYLMIGLFTAPFLPDAAFAEHYVLAGEVVARFYAKEGNITAQQTNPFSLLLESTGETWLMRSYFGEGTNWYYETYGVGDATYNVHYNPNANASWSMAGTVFPGRYPYHSPYHVTMPWVAWASSLFLAHEDERRMPVPSYIASSEAVAYGNEARVTYISNTHLKLPKSIRWIADADAMKAANTAKSLRVPFGKMEQREQLADLRYLMRPGDLMAEYEVTSETNIGGATIPSAFVFKGYKNSRPRIGKKPLPKPENIKFTRYLKCVFEGKLRSASRASGAVRPPPFPKSVEVADYRLANKALELGFARYTIEDGGWKTQIDSKLASLAREQEQKARRARGLDGMHRAAKLGIFLLICFAPPALFLIYQNAKRRKQLNQNATKE